ncbi:MAG TPA: S-layer homology domain-containing protein [Bacillus bacterium]|nr:S-layer homology domain-containing protein [Bacillus sp. (in: firmicutes)]
MNKKLINVLSTSFLVMALATGCGVATNDNAVNDRNRNNITPVGYDDRTNFTPLNVTDTNNTTPDANDVSPGTVDETPGADGVTGEQTNNRTPVSGGNTTDFTDVPKSHWAYGDIHAARDLGLLSGTDLKKNTFGFGQATKREEIASILMKAYRAGYMVGNNNNNNGAGANTTGTNNTNTTDVTGTTNNGGTIDTNGTDNTGTNAPNIHPAGS